MSENINILSSAILECPEMCYDFEKSEVRPSFTALLKALDGYYVSPTYKGDKIIFMTEIRALVPGWLYWLMKQHPYSKRLNIPPGSEWHWARVFIHKCIDMQCEISKFNLEKNHNERLYGPSVKQKAEINGQVYTIHTYPCEALSQTLPDGGPWGLPGEHYIINGEVCDTNGVPFEGKKTNVREMALFQLQNAVITMEEYLKIDNIKDEAEAESALAEMVQRQHQEREAATVHVVREGGLEVDKGGPWELPEVGKDFDAPKGMPNGVKWSMDIYNRFNRK